MEEETLIKIALMCVIIGLPLLYLVSFSLDPGEYTALEHRVVGVATRVVPGEYTKIYVEETRIVPVIVEGDPGIEVGMVIEATGASQRDAFFAESVTVHQPE